MQANEILKLIEEVDPTDTAKLDEIDMLVHCYLANREWGGWHDKPGGVTGSWGLNKGGSRLQNSYCNHSSFDHPTRSRDVLKAIRPKGYVFRVECHSVAMDRWSCKADKITDTNEEIGSCGWIKTEELAELHTILQAIQYERSKNELT